MAAPSIDFAASPQDAVAIFASGPAELRAGPQLTDVTNEGVTNASVVKTADGFETTADEQPGVDARSEGPRGSKGDDKIFKSGGTGGRGGDAGTVTVTYSGSGETFGSGANGIFARSAGGDGGNGGASTFSDGGSAGAGGDGSEINVSTAAFSIIRTEGDLAYGVQAASVGGIGGEGKSGGFILASGGRGGAGGLGGTVIIDARGEVITTGESAHAILGQSVGGGGGSGGKDNGLFDKGGGGASGGSASTVVVTLEQGASVSTGGEGAYGLLAHSIGGGGGTGGKSGGLSSIGGSGGAAANAGEVVVQIAGQVLTDGDTAHGVVAQSAGGGGGAAGKALGGVAIGGDGGSSGNGAKVEISVSDTGAIATSGPDAIGIFAQSIGGGGGTGASAGGPISVGGRGGQGGNGDAVNVLLGGTVFTNGTGGFGILAQSTGGGGGHGGGTTGKIAVGGSGGSGGDGGTVGVKVLSGAELHTAGDSAPGITATSTGGGGGSGGSAIAADTSWAVAVGGNGGDGGTAATASVDIDGKVSTVGDNSDAVYASSSGGGGGRGGSVITVTASIAATSVAVGGAGGGGGDGGKVNVTSSGEIETQGSMSRGLVAHSAGGGGGHGGSSIAVAASVGTEISSSVAIGIGGSGGDGGSGAAVTLTNSGSIVSNGQALSSAIVAQSIGGGGGSGGATTDVSASAASGASGSVAIGIGGSGGNGGSSDSVTADNTGSILTKGSFSYGMLVQSNGGGGGEGGSALTGSVAVARDDSLSTSVSIGGKGGGGGSGNAVSVTNSGEISTLELGAAAIVAQSAGGGGGVGAHATAYTLSGTKTAFDESGGRSFGFSVAVGGRGGGGGNAGSVDVDNSGNISTLGPMAYGIIAQSTGGGGGIGGHGMATGLVLSLGSNDLTKDVEKAQAYQFDVAVGGRGGNGGHGGAVTLRNTAGSVTTADFMAAALVAQSIGGGGGSAGSAETRTVSSATDREGRTKNSTSRDVTLSIGGIGGKGGNAGDVKVISAGKIETTGEMSFGVLAQSTGGGGGIGGHASSANLIDGAGKNSTDVGVTVGGNGGTAGSGAKVEVYSSGNIVTTGIFSVGIGAQSIGGGGGLGGSSFNTDDADVALGIGGAGKSGGNGGDVTISTDLGATISTSGETAFGLFAQSIGGGGGAAATSITHSNLDINIGRSGGNGGNAGKVTVENDGNIFTSGAFAHALFAQSVGGGGGYGGTANTAQGIIPKAVAISVGGHGGAGSSGNTVSIDSTGTIATSGDYAIAMIAQSIGGGGGAAGGAMSTQAIPIVLGASDGAGGANGGDVIIDLHDGTKISTSGKAAPGVFAQSIGGGGGLAGKTTENLCFGSSDSRCAGGTIFKGLQGTGGDGGAVALTVEDDATITTAGDFSHAIFAQSIAGGGGVGSDGDQTGGAGTAGADGVGGNVTITVDEKAVIVTNGYHANGIVAQSLGELGSGMTSITNAGQITVLGEDSHGIYIEGGRLAQGTQSSVISNSGHIRGGSGDGAGIYGNSDGAQVVNSGIIEAESGIAISGSLPLSIVNSGTINGNVFIDDGFSQSHTFLNQKGGVFNAGQNLEARLTNAGIISPGGLGKMEFTSPTAFTQTADGTFLADVDFGEKNSDFIIVIGTAVVSGHVQPNLMSMKQGTPVEIMLASGGFVTNPGDAPISVLSTPAVAYSLSQTSEEMHLGIKTVNFAAPGLTPQQLAAAQSFNQMYAVGAFGTLEPLMLKAANASSVASLAAALDAVHPAQHALSSVSLGQSAQHAASYLMSCGEREGPYAAIGEGQCVWAKGILREARQDARGGSAGYDESVSGLATGVQYAVSEHWRIGAGLGFEDASLSSGGIYFTDEERYNAGIVAKYVDGPLLLAAAVNGGYGSIESTRLLPSEISATPALGDRDVFLLATRLRAAYLHEFGHGWFAKPEVNFDIQRLHASRFHETGGAGLNHEVAGSTSFAYVVSPLVEIGRDIALEGGALIRPYVQIGATYTSHKQELSAGLDGLPDGSDPILASRSSKDWNARVSAGTNIFLAGSFELHLRYDGIYGGGLVSHGGSVKLAIGF